MHVRKNLCFRSLLDDLVRPVFKSGREIGELFHGTSWIK